MHVAPNLKSGRFLALRFIEEYFKRFNAGHHIFELWRGSEYHGQRPSRVADFPNKAIAIFDLPQTLFLASYSQIRIFHAFTIMTLA